MPRANTCSIKNLCDDDNCYFCRDKSFDKHPKSIYVVDKTINLRKIALSSHINLEFKCPDCNHIFIKSPNKLRTQWCGYCGNNKLCKKDDCIICFNKSFASVEGNTNFTLVNENPKYITKCSNKKYQFKCVKCNHIKTDCPNKIYSSKRECLYCQKKKLCDAENCEFCFNNSFASHPKHKLLVDKNLNPRMINIISQSYYNFKCSDCNHIIKKTISDINNNKWCRYCRSNPNLCMKKDCNYCYEKSFAKHPKSKYWSDKNKLKPCQVTRCANKKYIFNCHLCNQEFNISPHKIQSNRWCNKCKNKTEKDLNLWLIKTFPNLNIKMHPCYEWCKNENTNKYLPFDFEIEDYNLIIELDGEQHFEQVAKWGCYKKRQQRDIYKTKLAMSKGYSVIRIYQRELYDNKLSYDMIIKHIKKYITPELIILSKNKKSRYDYLINSVI
jgi:very-short-patch-repair endonuclease